MTTTTKRTVEVELSTTGMGPDGKPQRVPLFVGGDAMPMSAPPAMEPELEGEHMLINIGPQHPATHGVLRLVLELDGETVVRCIPHVGYLHCGFEKIGEYRQYNQIIPWTDREDYLNSPGNNVAFALGAERLFGIEITPRCTVLRVITMELSRIMSHLVWLGTTCIDIGAFTPFLWSFQERERIYTLIEQWTGARLTTTMTRVGGMLADIPDGTDIKVVDCFVNSEHVGAVVDDAIAHKDRLQIDAIWMQEGVIDEDAAERAREAGLGVVMDTCPKVEAPKVRHEGMMR